MCECRVNAKESAVPSRPTTLRKSVKMKQSKRRSYRTLQREMMSVSSVILYNNNKFDRRELAHSL